MILSDDVTFSYAVPGSGTPSSFLCHGASPWWLPVPITSPRFPTYGTRETTVQSLVGVGRPAPGIAPSIMRRSVTHGDIMPPLIVYVAIGFLIVALVRTLIKAYRRRQAAKAWAKSATA